MKIAYVPCDFDGSGCYRCFFPGHELQKAGHKVAVPPFNSRWEEGKFIVEFIDMDTHLEKMAADIVVLQRRLEPFILDLIVRLQELGSTVIVETDDYYLGLPSYNPAEANTREIRGNLGLSMAVADAITVSTPFLAEAYSRFGETIVLPNYLDWEMWEKVPLGYEREGRKLRVGWMGSAFWRKGDLDVLRGVIGPWLENHPSVEFVAAGDSTVHDYLGIPEAQRVSTNRLSFRDRDLWAITACMDIGLVPLAENNFNEAKSCLKGMEYAACGIPCIASPTEQYRHWVDEGENGLLARNRAKDWTRALDALLDEDLRREMGRKARAKAAEHTIQDHWRKWEATYEQVRSPHAVAA